jgi:hypothetical protein
MRVIALACSAAAAAFSMPPIAPQVGGYGDFGIGPSHKHRRGKGLNKRRGRGFRAKPPKRSNRLTISKRVRRKHRRHA